MIFDFNDKELYKTVRIEIMNQEKPFCLVDIVHRLDAKTRDERRLVYDQLDELYKEGLVDYRKVEESGILDSKEKSIPSAFYTEKCLLKKKLTLNSKK